MLELRQPLEPARRYQFRSPSSIIDAGSEHRADDRGVDQDGGREADPHLLQSTIGISAKTPNTHDHHDRGAGDDTGGRADAVGDGVLGLRPRSYASRIRLRTKTW